MAVRSSSASSARRRRRAPEDARQEILGAARRLIAERPLHEVTALVRPLRAEADAALAHWIGAADPIGAGRAALRAAAGLYREHGMILRALFWASAGDPELAAARHDLTESVIDAAVRAIGPVAADPDPRRLRATVSALVTMNVHSMLALPSDATDTELDGLVDTLASIWERATLP
jgi:AcrR family transcriptional regulator